MTTPDLMALAVELAARMNVACDRTRAIRGRDEVAVKTSDWHALMSLAASAKRFAIETQGTPHE